MDLKKLKELDKKYAQVIADYLLKQIEDDKQLEEKILTTDKTLQGCINYVKKEAQKQAEDGVAVILDAEVFGWAIHYFLEDEVNEEFKPTEYNPEKYKAPQKDKEVVEVEKPKKQPKKKEVEKKLYDQLSLFDL